MTQNIHLMGADDVARAGSSIRSAAEAIEKAASTMSAAADKMRQVLADFDYTVMNHQRFMTEWATHLRNSIEEVMPDLTAPLAMRLVRKGNEGDGEDEFVDVNVDEFDLQKAPTVRPPPMNSDRPTLPSPRCEDEPVD